MYTTGILALKAKVNKLQSLVSTAYCPAANPESR
jgi:hypothetical protein